MRDSRWCLKAKTPGLECLAKRSRADTTFSMDLRVLICRMGLITVPLPKVTVATKGEALVQCLTYSATYLCHVLLAGKEN